MTKKPGVFREFYAGVGTLGQGLKLWGTAPRIMWLGVVPALIVGIVFFAGILVLAFNLDSIAAWATPFADDWDEPFRTGTRVLAVLAFLALTVLIVVFTFTAITLIVGDPFYERIWSHVEKSLGDAPQAPEVGFWATAGRGILDALRILIPTVFIGLSLFALGFVPIVGQVAAPVLAAFFAGWFLTVELTGFAFDARGHSLKQRRKALGASRARTLGFGVATYLLFLLPLGAILVMPAAVAGATVLSRNALERQAVAARQARAAG